MTNPRKRVNWTRPAEAPLLSARIEKDKQGKFYSVVVAANGRDLFRSSESYTRAEHTEDMVKRYFGNIPIERGYKK